MTNSNTDPAMLREALTKLQTLPQKVREEVKSHAVPGSPVLPASMVLENVERLVRMFPCLTPEEAGGLLAATSSRSRTPINTLVSRLVPYVDSNHDRLIHELWECDHICGVFGRRVLDRVMKEVNNQRRNRGANEILQLEALIQIHRNQLMERQKEQGKEYTQEELDERVKEAYPEAVNAYLAAVGGDSSDLVIGTVTKRDLGYLREIKQYINEQRPDLSQPFNGQGLSYTRLVGQLLERSRQRSMGPITAQNAAIERKERAKHPNILYQPIDGRGPAKWGGVYPSVRKKEIKMVSTPTGEVGPSREMKVLSALGQLEVKRFKAERLFDPLSNNPAVMQDQALRIEEKINELMATPRDQGMWLVNVMPGEIGYEVKEVETWVERPDYGQASGFDAVDLNTAIKQMIEFHEAKGLNPPGGLGNPAHQIP